MVDWTVSDQQGRVIMDDTAQAQVAHGANFDVNLSSAALLHVTSSAPADLVVHLGHAEGHGRVVLNAYRGPMMGASFLPPDAEGRLILTNPEQSSTTVTWRGDGRTIAPGGHVEVDWPPLEHKAPPAFVQRSHCRDMGGRERNRGRRADVACKRHRWPVRACFRRTRWLIHAPWDRAVRRAEHPPSRQQQHHARRRGQHHAHPRVHR